MAPYTRTPKNLGPADFRPSNGNIRTDSTFHTPFFDELVWRALRTVVVMPARIRADPVLKVFFLQASPVCLFGARW